MMIWITVITTHTSLPYQEAFLFLIHRVIEELGPPRLPWTHPDSYRDRLESGLPYKLGE